MKYLLLLVMLLDLLSDSLAQRFLREGFSNQMDTDFRAEVQIEDQEAMQGMTREMFLMQDRSWELQAPNLQIKDPTLRRHIQHYFTGPIDLKLLKRKGKYGFRAVGKLENGKKVRAFWRQSTVGERLKASDFLEVPYDAAVRSRLFNVEFEVQLPPMRGRKDVHPSIVYQIPFESGGMNPKAMIPRGAGKIKVYPLGHEKGECIEAGTCNVGLPMKPGIIDPSWARGRAVFRKGRSAGVI